MASSSTGRRSLRCNPDRRRSLLPDSVRVIVRDWLNANHVLLLDGDDNVLIDSGYVTHADTTLRLVREQLRGRPLPRLINSHCHADHMGGNAALQRAFGCTLSVPAGEAALIERWDTQALWIDWGGQRAERFAFDAVIRSGDRLRMGGLDWTVLDAPGHDMGAVMFWNPDRRILISGDALWQRGFGVVLPGPGWRERLAATRDTLLRIRALAPAHVIPGHGAVFSDVGAAIATSLARVEGFENDEARLARHAVKVMFSFALMDLGSLDEDSLPDYLAAVPVYGEYDQAFLGLGFTGLAEWLVAELLRAGALSRRAGKIVAA